VEKTLGNSTELIQIIYSWHFWNKKKLRRKYGENRVQGLIYPGRSVLGAPNWSERVR